MKGLRIIITIFAVLFIITIAVFATGAVYIINEGQQVVITQFGRPMGNPIILAGLHFKQPFIQEAHYFEKRLLDWDGDPTRYPREIKNISG